MKWNLTLMALLLTAALSLSAQENHMVDVQSNFYMPENLTITVGDTVTWTNLGGFHNVNGEQSTYPNNPEGFGNGGASGDDWTYQHVFTLAGFYEYQCDPHVGLGMVGTVTVEEAVSANSQLVLTAVYDGPLTGGLPKGVELYALSDIADLSAYGIGSATNGGGSDGEEYTFPAESVSAGEHIYLSDEEMGFTDFFGFAPDYTDEMGNSMSINGDDAIELFFNGEVVDVFGDINTNGSGEPWEYADGWAYRVNGTGPDGTTFVLSNWSFSGPDALDDETTNAEADIPVPVGTYSPSGTAMIAANNDVASTEQDMAITLDVLANDQTPNGLNSLELASMPSDGTAAVNGDNTITYTPDAGFCGAEDSFDYEICDSDACDTATVTVTVDCPTAYPAYSIGQVTTVDADGGADSLGVTCELQGIVHGVNLREDGVQFTIIDDANDGIGVFNGVTNFGYDVNEGDMVVVQGEIDQFNGLLQIAADTVLLMSQGNALQQPTVATALGESTESQLVTVEEVSLVDPDQWGDGFSGFNVEVTDGSDTTVVRIDDNVDLFDMPAPTGTFNVTGIGGQFDSDAPFDEGYQLLPRYMEDIDPYVPEGADDYPVYSIAEVTTEDADGVADSLGVSCQLQGIVYGVNLRGNGLQFTIIDDNGDGIGVFNNSDDFGYTVTEGDEVILRGEIDQFNGLTQIFVEELEFVGSGNALQMPTTVTTLDESTESQLVRLEGLSLVDPQAWDDSGGSFNVAVTDGSSTFNVRVDNSTTLAGTAGPGDMMFNLTGIGGQFDSEAPFDSDYQLLPRYEEDLDIISSTVDQKLGSAIKVFPNPAREQLTIALDTDVALLSLRNALGQEVLRLMQVEAGTRTLSLDGMAPGLYTLVFRNGKRLWTEPLIIQ